MESEPPTPFHGKLGVEGSVGVAKGEARGDTTSGDCAGSLDTPSGVDPPKLLTSVIVSANRLTSVMALNYNDRLRQKASATRPNHCA